jgi:hypothetical protein
MHPGGAEAWQTAREYHEEHERLQRATAHLAHAVADLSHAASLVGDHASAVPLRETSDTLQLLQAQLAAAAEKAFSLAQLAARRAQHADLQRHADEALAPPEDRPA